MKAMVNKEYGQPDVLHLEDVAKPTPQANQVLVKVCAVSINAFDWHLLTADFFLVRVMGEGFRKPKKTILGADVAGRVEAVGADVTLFKPGDEVFGDLAGHGAGGFAEYVCAPESAFVLKPSTMSFEQAAAMPMAGVTALQGLRDLGKIQAGQHVLVNGASGGVGTYAIQLAKYYGAEVTAVCSTRNVERMRTLGADHVIDYTREDFTKSGKQYDLIIGANGYHPILDYRRALKPNGMYVMLGGKLSQIMEAMILGSLVSKFGDKKLVGLAAHPNNVDLGFLSELFLAGKITPVIDRTYTFDQIPDAMRYLGEGHAQGKIVITM